MHDLEGLEPCSAFQTLCWASGLLSIVPFCSIYIMHCSVLTKLQDEIRDLRSAPQCSRALQSESHWAELHLLIFCRPSLHITPVHMHKHTLQSDVLFHGLTSFCRLWSVALPSAPECSSALWSGFSVWPYCFAPRARVSIITHHPLYTCTCIHSFSCYDWK